jgi:hypothetical protein
MADKSGRRRGSSSKTVPDRDKGQTPEDHASESQADGTAAEATTSVPTGATEDAATEPEDVEKDLPSNLTMDSAGEIGEPSGRGNLDIDPEIFDRGRKKKPDEAA